MTDFLDDFLPLDDMTDASAAAPPLSALLAEANKATQPPKPPKPSKPRKPKKAGPAAYSEAPSENIHVNTPDEELHLVRTFGPIGLDPCSNETSHVNARVEWWGPPPKCHFCPAPATYGLSTSAIDRCVLHLHEPDADDGIVRKRYEIAPGILSDLRFGQDGLTLSWADTVRPGEVVFLQPPYGKYIKPWMPKANAEALKLKDTGASIIGLLPGRYDTRWFNSMRPAAICWYRHRIPYKDSTKPEQKDSAKFPSVFVYWGDDPEYFTLRFKAHGTITTWAP